MPHLRDAIEAFPPDKLRAWCEGLGQETFVGSSGRVFPSSLKASPLLRAWLRRLDAAGVVFKPRHRWTGWADDGALTFETPIGHRDGACRCDRAGARRRELATAWLRRKLGRDHERAPALRIAPLRPANAGVMVNWSDIFRDRFEGEPLKRIALVARRTDRARRGDGHAQRPRRRRHLCAVGADPRRDRRRRARRSCTSTCVPTSRSMR